MRQRMMWIGTLLVAVVLSACSAQTAAPTATDAPASPTAIAATEVIVQALSSTPTAENPPTQVAAVDYCITCHTDKDQLIQTGKPEEEKLVESEGAG